MVNTLFISLDSFHQSQPRSFVLANDLVISPHGIAVWCCLQCYLFPLSGGQVPLVLSFSFLLQFFPLDIGAPAELYMLFSPSPRLANLTNRMIHPTPEVLRTDDLPIHPDLHKTNRSVGRQIDIWQSFQQASSELSGQISQHSMCPHRVQVLCEYSLSYFRTTHISFLKIFNFP